MEARGLFDRDEHDREPPISPELFALQRHFFCLERGRRYDQGIPQPFSWPDVESYVKVMDTSLTPWQIDQLMTMDDYAILAHAKSETAPKVP